MATCYNLPQIHQKAVKCWKFGLEAEVWSYSKCLESINSMKLSAFVCLYLSVNVYVCAEVRCVFICTHAFRLNHYLFRLYPNRMQNSWVNLFFSPCDFLCKPHEGDIVHCWIWTRGVRWSLCCTCLQ